MSRHYQAGDYFLLRAAANPISELETILERLNEGAPLRITDIDEEMLFAIAIASPDLAGALIGRVDDDSSSTLTAQETATLRRYVKRSHTRATPFGTFSAVAIGSLADMTNIEIGYPSIRQIRARADFSWLMALLAEQESEEFPRAGVKYRFNSLAMPAGARVVLQSTDRYGTADNRTVNVRRTTALETVREVTQEPTTISEILHALNIAHPGVEKTKLDAFLDSLWTNRLLISESVPSQSDPRPDWRLAEWMASCKLPKSDRLVSLVGTLDNLSNAKGHDARDLLEIRGNQKDLSENTGPTLQVDSLLDTDSAILEKSLASEIATLVEALAKLNDAASRNDTPLDRYHESFLDEYGPGCLVPVATAVSALYGIDAPADYTNPPPASPKAAVFDPTRARTLGTYERVLIEELLESRSSGDNSIVMSDDLVRRLTSGANGRRPYPALDALVEIRSTSAEAMNAGDYSFSLRPESISYGNRYMSRFADILGEQAVAKFRDRIGLLKRSMSGYLIADLSYIPAYGRGANVAIGPRLAGYEVVVNVPPADSTTTTIPIDDIMVGSNGRHFYLWSKSSQCRLHVLQTHMLSLVAAPNVCRFLIEASLHEFTTPGGFSWGELEALSSLPRVTRGRAVLREAQWNLRRGDIWESGERTVDASADRALASWLSQHGAPHWVHLTEADNRLLLNVRTASDRQEVLSAIRRNGYAILQEARPPSEPTFVRDRNGGSYAAEFVIPLDLVELDSSPTSENPFGQNGGFAVDPVLPGGSWTQINLYLPAELQTDLITDHVHPFMRDLTGASDRTDWFFIRYADPENHVRLRFRTDREPLRLVEACHWARGLVADGLIRSFSLRPYRPEVSRYGGPSVFEHVEQFFAENSATSARAMSYMRSSSIIDLDMHALAVFSIDCLQRQFGRSLRQRMNLVPVRELTDEHRADFKRRRPFLTQLLIPWADRVNTDAARAHDALRDIFEDQAVAVTNIGRRLLDGLDAGELTQTPEDVVVSLMHMQVNRLMISGGEVETGVYSLWKQSLRALAGRPDLLGGA